MTKNTFVAEITLKGSRKIFREAVSMNLNEVVLLAEITSLIFPHKIDHKRCLFP